MLRKALRLLAPAACLMIMAGEPAAQEERFFETVDVNVVNIEVLVTDGDGNPVTGLSRDDFEVFEDGRPVEISNFFAVAGRELAPGTDAGAEAALAAAVDAMPGPQTKHLNLAIFVDDLNIWPQNRNAIFENLRGFLRDRLDPRDRVMLVKYDGGTEVAQPFTSDVEAIHATLDRLELEAGRHVVLDSERRMFLQQVQTASTRSYNPPPAAERDPLFDMAVAAAVEHSRSLRLIAERRVQKSRATVKALQAFCVSLAGIPGRKALLYVSDGIPQRPADGMVEQFSEKFSRWLMDNQQHMNRNDAREIETATMSIGSMEFDVSRQFRRLVEAASSERVAFYTISHRGSRGSQVSADVQGNASRMAGRLEEATLNHSLLDMAEGTGGLAFTGTTNVSALLDRVVDDFTSFYSLGYTTPPSEGGDFHKIEVKVRGKGLTVRHLSGYRDKSAADELDELALGAAQFGVGDNPLEVSIETGEPAQVKRKKYRVPVTIKIPFRKLVLVPDEGFHRGQLAISVTVMDETGGGVSPPQQVELPLQVPNDKILEAMGQVITYDLELETKPGNKRISVGVQDQLGKVDSSVSQELTVGEGGK
ncbi:MAG: VWA domain-containing protein [bacterium]|nr:VWA domain-containing protein [bacterium]